MKLRPVPQPPVTDRLAFVLPWACGRYDDQEFLLQRIRRRINVAIEAGTCERAYPKGARYRENFRILLDGGSKAFVQIGAIDTQRQKGGIRVEVNPAKFGKGDARQLHRVMRHIVGRAYDELIKTPLLNVVHFAVDILYACLSRMLVRYDNGQRMSVMAKRVGTGGFIEGYNFGSVSSDYQTAAYDKRQERVHAAILRIAQTSNSGAGDDPLKANKITQLKTARNGVETVRVEVRGKKLRGLPLWKLSEQTNRFARFRFADLAASGTALSPLTEQAFLAMCRQDGVKSALAAFKHTKQARKVHAFWRSRQADWWQPEALWLQACAQLRALGIFPEEAFIAPSEPVTRPATKARIPR